MRKQLLCSVAAVAITTALSGPVAAADQRPVYKAPVSQAPACMWCGFYVGGHLGYGRTKFDAEGDSGGSAPVTVTGSIKPSGIAVGLHSGYNWQVGQWVYGIESDGTVTPWEKDDRWDLGTGRIDRTAWNGRLDWLSSIRARLGFAFDRTLIYATGGVGFGSAKVFIANRDTYVFANFRPVAAVAGGGIEWKASPNISFRLEGLHYFFNKSDSAGLDSGRVQNSHITMKGVSVIRTGASWHFDGSGWGKGPVAAGY